MRKVVLKLSLLIAISIALGTVLMVAVYSLPLEKVYEHMEESRDFYENGPVKLFGTAQYAVFDYTTEQYMLNNAIFRPYDRVIDNALINPHFQSNDVSVKYHFLCLLDGVDHSKAGKIVPYDRYWHGYLLYLVPALELVNVSEVKMILLIVEFILFSFVIIGLGKIDISYSFAFLISALFINPVMTAMCLQYADIYIISMFFTCMVLFADKWLANNNRYVLLFAINGIMVSYFDFFTYPLVALGFPLIALLLVQHNDNKCSFRKILQYSCSWGIAYIAMWAGKFAVAELFTDRDVFKEAINQVIFRTVGDASSVGIANDSYAATLRAMGRIVTEPPMLLLLLLLGVGVCLLSLFEKKKIRNGNFKDGFVVNLPFLFITILPFIYYLVVKNHSVVHPWIEYRELALSVFGVGIIISNLLFEGIHSKKI